MREKIEALESTAQVVYNVLNYHVNTISKYFSHF